MTTERHAQRGHIAVVGGGIIGLSTGYQLARAGYSVTLIERDKCGDGASWGNAGWIVPSLVQPFNSPGVMSSSLRAMLNPHSSLALRQPPTPTLLRWAFQFARSSRAERSQASMRALTHLSASATDDVVALADELGFEVHRTGLLVPFRSSVALDEYVSAHAAIESMGYSGRLEVLDRAEVMTREPSLSDDVVGAVHLVDEVSVRPVSMVEALARALKSQGGEIVEHEEVLSLDPTDRGGWRVRTQERLVAADAVVVAAGEGTTAILRRRGIRIALQSGRGCSVTLPASVLALNQPMKIAEYMVACTPFENGEVRISGTMDLVRPGAGTARRRMQSVLNGASTHLPALEGLDVADLDVWSGARPCTPDSLPIIEQMGSSPGLYVAAGHGTLGVTLSLATGRIVTEMISEPASPGPNTPSGLL